MAKLIKNWDELAGLESENYKIEVMDNCCGWIRPKIETEETQEDWLNHHAYLSTHTFYGETYQYSTEILQNFGFDVEIDNWDKESGENE